MVQYSTVWYQRLQLTAVLNILRGDSGGRPRLLAHHLETLTRETEMCVTLRDGFVLLRYQLHSDRVLTHGLKHQHASGQRRARKDEETGNHTLPG